MSCRFIQMLYGCSLNPNRSCNHRWKSRSPLEGNLLFVPRLAKLLTAWCTMPSSTIQLDKSIAPEIEMRPLLTMCSSFSHVCDVAHVSSLCRFLPDTQGSFFSVGLQPKIKNKCSFKGWHCKFPWGTGSIINCWFHGNGLISSKHYILQSDCLEKICKYIAGFY